MRIYSYTWRYVLGVVLILISLYSVISVMYILDIYGMDDVIEHIWFGLAVVEIASFFIGIKLYRSAKRFTPNSCSGR